MKKSSINSNKTRLLHVAGALLLISLATPATAAFSQEGSATASRLDQLENQIQTLSRALYRGETPPAGYDAGGGSDVSASALNAYETRIADLEKQQRSLIGQLEEVRHDNIQLKDKLEKLTADFEQRLQALENGASAKPTPLADAPVPQPPSAPAPADTSSPTPPSTSGTLGTLNGADSAQKDGADSAQKDGADSAQTLYESAFADVRDANYGAAEKKLKDFMKKYSDHALAGNAQYWLGETYYVRGDYRQAAKMFAQGYQDYPKNSKTPDSLMKLGLSLSKLGKKDDACISLLQLKKQFPKEQTAVITRANQEIKTLGCK